MWTSPQIIRGRLQLAIPPGGNEGCPEVYTAICHRDDQMWQLPKMRVPPVIIHFSRIFHYKLSFLGFSIINYLLRGTLIYGNPHVMNKKEPQSFTCHPAADRRAREAGVVADTQGAFQELRAVHHLVWMRET